MKDIAQRCGVSVASVSKALNGQQDIGQETRERILRAADEMGYLTNSAARALKTNRAVCGRAPQRPGPRVLLRCP